MSRCAGATTLQPRQIRLSRRQKEESPQPEASPNARLRAANSSVPAGHGLTELLEPVPRCGVPRRLACHRLGDAGVPEAVSGAHTARASGGHWRWPAMSRFPPVSATDVVGGPLWTTVNAAAWPPSWHHAYRLIDANRVRGGTRRRGRRACRMGAVSRVAPHGRPTRPAETYDLRARLWQAVLAAGDDHRVTRRRRLALHTPDVHIVSLTPPSSTSRSRTCWSRDDLIRSPCISARRPPAYRGASQLRGRALTRVTSRHMFCQDQRKRPKL